MDHRKVKEDLAQKDFQEALMVLNDLKAKLTELENAIHEAHLRVGVLQKQGGAQGPALSQINDFLRNQKILIQMQQVKIFNQEKVVEEKRILLTQAAVETKIISKFKEKKFKEKKFKEKKFEEYKFERESEEQKEMDEQSILRYKTADKKES